MHLLYDINNIISIVPINFLDKKNALATLKGETNFQAKHSTLLFVNLKQCCLLYNILEVNS